MTNPIQNFAAKMVNKTRESFSVKAVIFTAVLTMMTTGTVQFLGEHALAQEQQYWAKYKAGQDAKDRWWDSYFKAITKNCGN